MAQRRPTVFLVDDDDVAVMAFQRAANQHKLTAPIKVARDGDEALDRLRHDDDLQPPYVIVLDLNMPRMGGLEFLGHLRADPMLKKSVVFVSTTSDAPQDIDAAYGLNVSGYFVKENAYRTIASTVSFLNAYLDVVTLPVGNIAKV